MRSMQHVIRFVLCGTVLLTTIRLTAAQQPLTPVMRIGDWVEIGGEVPVVVIFQAEKHLKAASYDPGPVDGILDAKTQVALRQYQTEQGLPATGVLDQATRKALGIDY